ncbi:protein of unknown function [Burkholderia multivorans]
MLDTSRGGAHAHPHRDPTRGRESGAEIRRAEGGAARRAQRESSAISVEAAEGVVTLTGTVDSLAEKRAACGAAWLVKGVREVIDRLTVA